jgi:hypothetical protein
MATPAETVAYAHMQARLIALLLRHDEARFRQYIADQAMLPEDAAPLRLYRDLAVLFFLRDELFEHILPRIVRRLSFESPRSMVVEEPPGVGRVNWERTLDATWAERPGEPPLALHTRQRRRDFATPENLLTVATLLEYQADVRTLLWGDADVVGTEALRHPLNEIVEHCERELAFPQFAGLRAAAQHIIEGEHDGVEALEARVAGRAIPGGNGAYEELLTWRERRRTLQLLRRDEQAKSVAVLGADPKRDNYLYQLWIFYELADLLQARGQLEQLDTQQGKMSLRFRWGAGADGRVYELRHDQSVPDPVVKWESFPNPHHVPGVRPDFYVRRIHPSPERVEHDGVRYWREPGVVWDAKYYRERDSPKVPATPIKRMITDLALLGERYGVLLFAFLKTEGTATAEDEQWSAGGAQIALTPRRGVDQTTTPDQRVVARQLQPESMTSDDALRQSLTMLLDDAHCHLRTPQRPRCHGVFLDALSAAEQDDSVDRYGAALEGPAEELLVCPKPHIGSWRVDLVSRERHCCQDARLCHIIDHPDARKPVRPPRSAEELLRELQHLFAGADDLDPETVSAIARQVEGVTRRFAELAGAYKRIEVYYNRLRDMGMHRTLSLLGATERESLALAVFLVEQLDSIGASDYSAPAIHVSSVVEIEVKRRIFACPGLESEVAQPKKQTLGVLPFMRWKPQQFSGDWERIVTHAAAHWQGNIDPDDPDATLLFDTLTTELEAVKEVRNKAAHTSPVARTEYEKLFRIACQSGKLKFGALNVLLLAWQP